MIRNSSITESASKHYQAKKLQKLKTLALEFLRFWVVNKLSDFNAMITYFRRLRLYRLLRSINFFFMMQLIHHIKLNQFSHK